MDGAMSRSFVLPLSLPLLLVMVLGASGCVHKSSGEPCPVDQQITLISTRLDRLAPSPPFTVGAKNKVFAATTIGADPEQLFGGALGIATLRLIRDGAQPAVTVDP